MRTAEQIDDILSSSLERFMGDNSIPGIAVGIVLDGKLAYTKGFGVKNIENHDLITEESMFHSASISKTFVTTSLIQLQERGLVDINKFVTEYLPYLKLKDERFKKITVKQMMSHLSGMPDVYDYEWDNPQYEEDALEKYVKSIYDIALLWEPGEGYSYSNLAYEMLGDVIAKASGMSFESYVKQNILQPLGMMNSSFLIREIAPDKMTSPHIINMDDGYKAEVNPYYPYNRIHGPSSTLWSNVSELCRYAIAHINGGSFENFILLKKDSYDMMWKSYAETNREGTTIGLSWFIKNYKGVKLIFHTGGDTGYTSNLVLIPEKKAALAFYCNCDYINLSMITEHILDIMLDYEVEQIKNSATPEIARILIDKGIEAAKVRFEEIRNLNKKDYYISEGEFNSMAYKFLRLCRVEDAIAILMMAIKELPKAANLYDSLGEMYLENGDRERSIESYQKALQLDPHMSSSITALKNLGIV
ncbi:MAG TPA: serine hydrolase [Patescibacteria group bacterium]|nr:serine hydrolase [Patescibacteria group bacterium]